MRLWHFLCMNRWGKKKIKQVRRQRVCEFLQALHRGDA